MKASRRQFLILALLAPNSGVALAAAEQVRRVRIGILAPLPSACSRSGLRKENDLLFAIGPEQPARALIDAKAGRPLILLAIDYDPVKAGLVSSLRRPGGNVIGMMLLTPQLMGKRLELLREISMTDVIFKVPPNSPP